VAAILGLLLAIQINYKLEWSFVKSALNWHVNFGIALSLVAIIHLIWHIDYYLNIFRKNGDEVKEKKKRTDREVTRPGKLKQLILLLGFVATIVQVLLLREITTVFQGNEIMMGWTIGAWMLLTGIGSFLGRNSNQSRKGESSLSTIVFLLSITPIVSVVLMSVAKNTLFPPGTLINPLYFLIILLLLLAPVALLSGYTFSILVTLYRKKKDDFIIVYALESMGSLIGGLLVSFVFIYWFSILQSLIIVLSIVSIALFIYNRFRIYILSFFISVFLVIISFFIPFDDYLKSLLFVNQHISETRETFYGNLTVTENAGQYSIYENGSLLFTSDNVISNEEYVHYAMLQKRNPESVLLIGGGISGMLSEILKYKTVEHVDYVEINPQLIEIASKYVPVPGDPEIHIIKKDGRKFLQNSDRKYDVVILALPDPSSLQINRFYTSEFINILKKTLNKNAVVLFSHSAAGNYMTPEKSQMEAALFNTLKSGFSNIEIIPGEEDYFIAGDSTLSISIAALYSVSEIENVYVNSDYIDDFSIKHRSDFIKQSLEGEEILNTDTKPFPVFLHSLQFLSLFGQKNILLVIIPVLILLLPVFFMRPVSAGIFTAGFTASSIELLLIFSFQTFWGYIYSAIGVIVAVFMGGLAAGSILSYRFQIKKKHFIMAQGLLVTYALLFPLFWKVQNGISSGFFGIMFFLVVTFILSSILGFQYVAGTKSLGPDMPRSAVVMYASDLLGSALGVIAITLLLLPLLGMTTSCLIIAGFNLVAIGVNIGRPVN